MCSCHLLHDPSSRKPSMPSIPSTSPFLSLLPSIRHVGRHALHGSARTNTVARSPSKSRSANDISNFRASTVDSHKFLLKKLATRSPCPSSPPICMGRTSAEGPCHRAAALTVWMSRTRCQMEPRGDFPEKLNTISTSRPHYTRLNQLQPPTPSSLPTWQCRLLRFRETIALPSAAVSDTACCNPISPTSFHLCPTTYMKAKIGPPRVSMPMQPYPSHWRSEVLTLSCMNLALSTFPTRIKDTRMRTNRQMPR
ncbi:hypothetical protein F5I97DRAFT_234659 [Phlebopus sp. FC_14]|nr:hypothetical protein F5I97DRAFT_234659 [Phlebopus sp. FC_14]